MNWAIMQALVIRPYVRVTQIHADKSNGETNVKISVDVKNFGPVDARDLRIWCAKQPRSKLLHSLFPGGQRDKIGITEVPMAELVSPNAESRDLVIDLVYEYAGRLRKYKDGQRALLKGPEHQEVEWQEQTSADEPQS